MLATIIRVGRQQTRLKDDALTGKSEDEILFNKCAIIYPFLWKSHAFQTTCAICMGAPVQKIKMSSLEGSHMRKYCLTGVVFISQMEESTGVQFPGQTIV